VAALKYLAVSVGGRDSVSGVVYGRLRQINNQRCIVADDGLVRIVKNYIRLLASQGPPGQTFDQALVDVPLAGGVAVSPKKMITADILTLRVAIATPISYILNFHGLLSSG